MWIDLLGRVALRRDDGDEVSVPSPKCRALLALLALRTGEVMPVSELIEEIWQGNPPPTARAALQGHVASLRKLLAGDFRLVTREPGYVLTGDREHVDALRFERMCDTAAGVDDAHAVALLQEALDLWNGSWVPGGNPFIPHATARHLEEARLAGLEQLADRLVRLDRGIEAVDDLTEAVRANPMREPLVALLMTALDQAGQVAKALATYERTATLLAEELGIDPSARLAEARARLQASHTEADPSAGRLPADGPFRREAPAQLPRESRGFAGRAADLARLSETVDRAGTAPVLVVGAAGVGKTGLVVRWARENMDRFPDGQLFVNVRGFDETDPLDAVETLGRLLRALGVAEGALPRTVEERSQLFRDMLSDRRVLVVLDNARTYDQVAPVLSDAPATTTLVTSRNRLGDLVVGEDAVPFPLEVLDREGALELMAQVIGRSRVAAELPTAARIVDLCGRLPLALRIAAARLVARPDWALQEMADEMADEQLRLAALETDGSLGVASALALTCRALPPDADRLLALLGAHPGQDIDPYAAAALADVSLPRARTLLARLDAAHLVEETAPGMFTRYDLVRLYTCDRLAELPATDQLSALDRLLDYYHGAVEETCTVMGRPRAPLPGDNTHGRSTPPLPDAARALDWFQREEPTIRELAKTAASRGRTSPAVSLAYHAAPAYYHDGGFLAEWESLARTGLDAATISGDRFAILLLQMDLATVVAEANRLAESADILRAVLPEADKLADPALKRRCRSLLATCVADLGRLPEAAALFEEAIELAEETGDQRGLAQELANLAECLLMAGEPERALPAIDRSVALLQDCPTDPFLLMSIQTRTEVLRALGRPAEALAYIRTGLEQCRQQRDTRQVALYADFIGDVLLDLGRIDEAVAHWREALELFRLQGRPIAKNQAKLDRVAAGQTWPSPT
ncbi:SARP family transcriptional regulator [Kitasatospora sp. NE20-6]|uniref:AfsR/SARP family transcriptional regulator n=1 Tax=Kitasatospora sp. NE20-6 TaxID=2859066 RepID=UPI0034DC147F